eukprot:68212_1
MLTISISLDLFYLKLFTTNSIFMQIYGSAVTVFGITGCILFLIWICWCIYEIFISKWNVFCCNTIASKHPNFIASGSFEQFIGECNKYLTNDTDEPITEDVISPQVSKRCDNQTGLPVYDLLGWIFTIQIVIVSIIILVTNDGEERIKILNCLFFF